MSLRQIRRAPGATPFRPFKTHLADGGRLEVPHEDFVALDPTGCDFIVYRPDGSHQIMDVRHVRRLEMMFTNGRRSRSKR
ncbi:MAG: hypothetical protein RMK20_14865 [Verrucomicrobiales bacterium]|nr:hypothetical protein [Verrucomicrobiales bacterium]